MHMWNISWWHITYTHRKEFFSYYPPCDSSVGKESACNVGDLGSIPVLARSPGEGNSYPLQYSGLENSMDCIVHGVAKSQTWLSDFHTHIHTQPSRCWFMLYILDTRGKKNLWCTWFKSLYFPGGSDGKNVGDPGSGPGLGRFPEEGNTTHSSILAWRIPWTEEPGRLLSMGSQRIRHHWGTNTFTFTQQYQLNI